MQLFITKVILLVFLQFVTSGIGRSSLTEAQIHPEKVTFSSPEGKMEVIFTESPEEGLKIQVKINDVVTEVPKAFLFEASDLIVESIRLKVPNPDLSKSPWTQAADVGFFIVFEFGGEYEHGTQTNPVDVRKALMIEFETGRAVFASVAIPSGEYKNQWTIKDHDLRFLDPKDQNGESMEKNQIKCSFLE